MMNFNSYVETGESYAGIGVDLETGTVSLRYVRRVIASINGHCIVLINRTNKASPKVPSWRMQRHLFVIPHTKCNWLFPH